MKIAFITTIYNEEKNIQSLLDSLRRQSKKPDQVVIVDGGSKDQTVFVVKEWVKNLRSEEFRSKFKLVVRKGNRSIGRNEAIRRSNADIIVSSDSGCILDKDFIKNITLPFKNQKIDVVAGFYKSKTSSVFEKSLVPYVLVMPDRVNPRNFLPAARSMAFRKSIWKKIGGFPTDYSYNEDYIFAKKLKRANANILFRRKAYVFYIPRGNLIESFTMFFKFAFGDAESGILRPKVVLIFLRYAFWTWLLIYSYIFKLSFITKAILYILALYIIWSIWKNYRYVKSRKALFFLPLIQITSDIAIIFGSAAGFFEGLWDTQVKR